MNEFPPDEATRYEQICLWERLGESIRWNAFTAGIQSTEDDPVYNIVLVSEPFGPETEGQDTLCLWAKWTGEGIVRATIIYRETETGVDYTTYGIWQDQTWMYPHDDEPPSLCDAEELNSLRDDCARAEWNAATSRRHAEDFELSS